MQDQLKHGLLLLAMGNWVNSQTAPLDPDAPGPSGTAGSLRVSRSGEESELAVHQASLLRQGEGRYLFVEGEPSGSGPSFALAIHLSETTQKRFDQASYKTSDRFPVRPDSAIVGSVEDPESNQQVTVTQGAFRVLSVTGSGPWELDAELELEVSGGDISAFLKARVE